MAQDLGALLARFGLQTYAKLLEDNAIDVEVLPDLTERDLEQLGIPMGHRKKMLKVIRSLAVEDQISAEPDARALPRPEPERRQLTVMMCDMVGSTALSERFDPEDLKAIMAAYQECCQQVIAEHGGTISRYVGDGIFAYFGYPQADEVDAERAIRAGLEIAHRVDRLAPLQERLQVRVGIATGLVLIGEAPHQVESVFGGAPNLAARLQTVAAPGTVATSDSTRRLAIHQFKWGDLGRHELKGFAEPIQAWQVVGQSHIQSRSAALDASTELTPLVAREEEIELLRRRWQRARNSEGQLVLITGDAGIGKSRLAQTLRRELADEPHLVVRLYCSPHHQNSALYPVIEHLSRAAGFSPGDTDGDRLDKLEGWLSYAADDAAAVAPLLADLLSIPPGDRYPPSHLSPQGRKQRTLTALEELLVRSARRGPMLVMFEDLHWSDPTTRELLDRAVDRIPDLPILMLVTTRPGAASPWSDRHYATTLSLRQLSPQEALEFVKRLAGDKPLPLEIVSQLVVKTDGNPLFIEELYKGVIEGGLLRDEGDHYALSAPTTQLLVPSTLTDSLMARLDRISPIKEVAQIASALGRQFSLELLAGVTALEHERLVTVLEQLGEAKIIYRRASAPESTYAFKHALLQDAAYSSMLRSKRELLHAKIARLLEERYPEKLESEPELVAYHYTGAGLAEQAIAYWHKAGRRALQRSANTEAVGHLRRGLSLLATCPATPERAQKELALLTSLGPALSATKGFASAEVEATYISARTLCRKLGDTSTDFSALRGLWVYYFIRADLRTAHEFASQLLEVALREERSGQLVEAHRVLGQTLLYRGDLATSRTHLERGLALYDPEQHRANIYLYGNDSRIVCSSYLAYVMWLLGQQDEALRIGQAALRDARQLAHPFSLALALAFAAYLHQHIGDAEATRRFADEAIAISTEQGFPFWARQEAILSGWALAQQGQVEEGIRQIAQGLEDYRKMGSGLACPWFLGLFAEVLVKGGQLERGLQALEEALAISERTGERIYVAEIHRLRGEVTRIARGPGAAAEVERDYQRAMAVAGRQGAAAWEIRAGVSCACLRRDRGDRRAARKGLEGILERFEADCDTVDLAEARALLDQLRPS